MPEATEKPTWLSMRSFLFVAGLFEPHMSACAHHSFSCFMRICGSTRLLAKPLPELWFAMSKHSLLHIPDAVSELTARRAHLREECSRVSWVLRLAQRRRTYHGAQKLHGLTDVQWATAAFVCVLSAMSESTTEYFCARRRERMGAGTDTMVLHGSAVRRSLVRAGVLNLDHLLAHIRPGRYRHTLLRAVIFVAEMRVFSWVTDANGRGVFPWTRDVAEQLRLRAADVVAGNETAQSVLSTWLGRQGGADSNVRVWGCRFRSRWGLKYGRGIILAPMSPSEMERKVPIFCPSVALFSSVLGATSGVKK